MVLSLAAYHSFIDGQMMNFYDEVYPGLLSYAGRRLGAEYGFLAEDCVQDVIFAVYLKRQTISSPQHLHSMLYASLHNRIISLLRHEEARLNYTDQTLNTTREASDDLQLDLIEQETLTNLFRAIDALPEELRQIFDLNFEQGLTITEVAHRLNVSESTVKRRKQLLIDSLRKDLVRCLMLLFL